MGVEVGLTVNLDYEPKKTCSIWTKRKKTGKELEQLIPNYIYELIQCSKLVAQIVAFLNGDGSGRICGEYKQTINQALLSDKYPVLKA